MKYLLFLLFPISVVAQRPVDISSTFLPGIPTLTVIGSFSTFTATSGSSSSPQSTLTVAGVSLTANIVLSFSGGGATSFEVSVDGGSTYASTKSLTSSSGIVNTTTIFVRTTSSAAIGSPSATLNVASTGASPIGVSVNGVISSGSTAHWRAITIPSSSVSGGSNLTNFTALVSISGTYLATVANGGKIQNASGFDIKFAADNAGATLYNWEIESWNPVTGVLVAWVKIPTLSASVTTTIYLLYGGSETTFQGGATGSAWDANTVAVYHNGESITASGQSIKDWSANSHTQTSAGTWTGAQSVTGKIGNALKYLSANSDRSTFTSIALSSTYTVDGWYQATSGLVDGDTYAWANTSTFDVVAFGDPATFFGLFAGTGQKVQDGSAALGNTWYHMVFTRNGTTWKMYRNGSLVTTNTTDAVNVAFNNIGTVFSGFTNDIIFDEGRLLSIDRPLGWITTEYNNENSNSTWLSVGAEN